jgi:hypothetical protein
MDIKDEKSLDNTYMTPLQLSNYFNISLSTIKSALRSRLTKHERYGRWRVDDFKRIMGIR